MAGVDEDPRRHGPADRLRTPSNINVGRFRAPSSLPNILSWSLCLVRVHALLWTFGKPWNYSKLLITSASVPFLHYHFNALYCVNNG
ncbi:hypothetical protein ANCCAN_26543 [Ancylostoma caninum]|uniref:Uncharacterized protein n=1 Tax=Ancylostoma caninum TaxID=29170 RepID=A0A368F6F4_ANCCA|nr:hypothetical protein ANCCAN_26543 [Ancylostoma caninum]